MYQALLITILRESTVLAIQGILYKYRTTPVIAKWYFWIYIPIFLYNLVSVHRAMLSLHHHGQFHFRYCVIADALCATAVLLNLLMGVCYEIHTAVDGQVHGRSGFLLTVEIEHLHRTCPKPANAHPDSPERELLEKARVAAEAHIALKEYFIARYTSYYPLGVFKVLLDKAGNIDTPFTTEGKLKGITTEKQMCIAIKTHIAAEALETDIGFDERVAWQMLNYEDWLRDLENKERRLLGTHTVEKQM